MTQDLKGGAPSSINVRNEDELRWSATELGVTDDQVRGAVSNVGDSPDAVRAFLQTLAKSATDEPTGDR